MVHSKVGVIYQSPPSSLVESQIAIAVEVLRKSITVMDGTKNDGIGSRLKVEGEVEVEQMEFSRALRGSPKVGAMSQRQL
jgi:hypothetical protein